MMGGRNTNWCVDMAWCLSANEDKMVPSVCMYWM